MRDLSATVAAALCGALPATLAAAVFATLPVCSRPAPGAPPLGLPLDQALIRDVPALAHFARALRRDDLRVADLFTLPENAFAQTPDPTDYFRFLRLPESPSAAAAPAVNLHVLTYNIALLDARIFWGLFPYLRAPLLDERRAPLAEAIFSSDHEVVFLQELWRGQDVALFIETAKKHGYAAFASPRADHTDGLVLFVKAALVAGQAPAMQSFTYDAQVPSEYFPGPRMKRGFEHVVFVHEDLGTIHLFNTHMTAFPQNWQKRMSQARQLGLAARQAAQDGSSLVLLGGDLNGGPYYPEDVFHSPQVKAVPGWWCNTLSYFLVLYYGGLTDLALAAAPSADADVTAFAENHRSPATWPFTVDETTNSIYAEQYLGQEFPARIDHLFGLPASRLAARSTKLAFGDKHKFGGASGQLSDHFGVSVTLDVRN